MKKYKLKKQYPGCDIQVGEEVQYHANSGFYCCSEQDFPRHNVENYPEYWEEVIVKEYEILELSNKEDSSYKCNGHNIDSWLRGHGKKSWEIFKVKRLSDNEVFSIGDKVTNPAGQSFTITKFYLDCNNVHMLVGCDCEAGHVGISKIKKYVEPTPKLITEDGKKLYVGDRYWFTSKLGTAGPFSFTVEATDDFSMATKDNVRFSSEALAQAYIDSKKPKVLLTTEDGKDLYESDYNKVLLYWTYKDSDNTWSLACDSHFRLHHLTLVKDSMNYTPFVDKVKRDEFMNKKNEENLLDSKVLSYNDMINFTYPGNSKATYFNSIEEKAKLKELVKSKM